MKYQLETIPVWDALRDHSECLICSLMAKSEEDALSYYLGSSVMHPETRQEVNKKGFCPTHWAKLLNRGETQALSLIAHTYLQETQKHLSPMLRSFASQREGKGVATHLQKVQSYLAKRERGCLVCQHMQNRFERYAYTTMRLWLDDSDFRAVFDSSPGLCLYHSSLVSEMAHNVLKKSEEKVFLSALFDNLKRNLERLEGEVLWMTQKFKDENRDKSWDGCEDAQKRVIEKIVALGRIWDLS